MEDRPVGHRARQVGREAAVGQHVQAQSAHQAVGVKAHRVVVGKRVAFPRDHEIVVAVQPHLDGAAQVVRRHGRPHRHVAGLRLLAAEAAAHAPAFHLDAVVVQAQRVRHPVLHLAGVLRAAVHQPLALLLWQHIGHLAFEVEVFLSANLELAAHHVCAPRASPAVRVAARHLHRRQHIALRGVRGLAASSRAGSSSICSLTSRAAWRAC